MNEFYNEGREEGADRNERLSAPFQKETRRAEKSYDVVIIGGGVAGCASALSARRSGSSVLLVEKMTMLGGLATAGHITIYLPLCDGYGHQVLSGLSEELLKLSARDSYHDDYATWKERGKRYETKFNGPAFALALEEQLLSEGVDILYDTLFVGCQREGEHVEGVYLENEDGRTLVPLKVLIDASGSAEVFHRLGGKCFSRENSLAEWGYATKGGEIHEMTKGSCLEDHIRLIALGTVDKSARTHKVNVPYFGDTAEGVDAFVKAGHDRLRDVMKAEPDLVMASLPSMPQFRMVRRMEGLYTLTESDASRHFEDNIGGCGDWRRPGPCYEIPYRCLCSESFDNVLAAGRCISSADIAWEITRVIPPAVLTGEACGIAATLAWKEKRSCASLEATEIREEMKRRGNLLDINL